MKQIETNLPPKLPFYDDPDFNPYLAYVAAGFAVFTVANFAAHSLTPACLCDATFQLKWRWRNILTSFFHSLVTGVCAPALFFLDPSLGDDMINGFYRPAHVLISFSVGYFIYDFVDMYLYSRHRSSTREMLVHHLVVILCFGIAAANRVYVPYATVSLVAEVNSVFLHARQLLIYYGTAKKATIFRTVALLNVLTYILFRILLLGWMTRWLTLHREDVPLLTFTIGSVGLATIFMMNITNFYRLLMSDFTSGRVWNKKFFGDNPLGAAPAGVSGVKGDPNDAKSVKKND